MRQAFLNFGDDFGRDLEVGIRYPKRLNVRRINFPFKRIAVAAIDGFIEIINHRILTLRDRIL